MGAPPSQNGPTWATIDAALDRALDLEGAERAGFLEALDPAVRDRVEKALTGQDGDAVDAIVRASLGEALSGVDAADVPDVVGPWRLVRRLGAGGMAQVFEARRVDVDFEQRAAVKILWPSRDDAVFQERMIQERRILAGLHHPGIAGLLDGGMLPNHRPWFAMEYVEGTPIDDWCETFDLPARLEVFLQVCEAVEFAHAQLVVHRDIKPANILVDGAGRVKLLDFGIAKLLDAVDVEAVTRTGGSLLTLQYASPEQVTRAPVTVASDVYQLGMLLYQLVAGRLPYDLGQLSLKRSIDTICETPPPPPSRFVHGLDGDLDAITHMALRKDPDRRYRSVSALARDVRLHLEGRPVVARPANRWYVFRRFVRRNAVPVAATAVVIGVLAVATIVSVSQARRASLEAERSQSALDLLTGVFDQADPFGQPGEDLTLRDALVQRMDGIEAQVRDDPVLATRVLSHLGGIFTQLGTHDQAERAYRQSLAAAGNDPGVADAMQVAAAAGVAGALNQQGRFRETLAFIDGLDIDAEVDAATASQWVHLELYEAVAHLAGDDTAAADDPLRSAQGLVETHGLDDPELMYLLHGTLASRALKAQDFEDAARQSRLAAEWAGEAGRHGARAILLQNHGIHLARQGRLDEARPYFLDAMAIVETHAPGHPSGLEFAVNYAGLLYRDGEHSAAVTLLRDTIGALDGTPDRHLWVYAHRDLATYAFGTGEVDTSVEANREVLLEAPRLYGLDAPPVAVAEVMLARHLSFAGFHDASLATIEDALAMHPRIGAFDLSPYRAELRLDAGLGELARRDYDPDANADDPNAELLGLKFACDAGDVAALESRIAAIDPEAKGDTHLDRRLLAWRAIMEAALAGRAGAAPDPGLRAAYDILASTPRLSSLEDWRLLREIVPVLAARASLPTDIRSAWADVEAQRAMARERLADGYLPADSPLAHLLDLDPAGGPAGSLACLSAMGPESQAGRTPGEGSTGRPGGCAGKGCGRVARRQSPR